MPALSDRARRQVQAAVDRFMRQYGTAREAQQRLLKDILRRNADTEFGRAHGFAGIGGLDDYRKQVPVRLWPDYEAHVDAMIAGRPNVLTAEPPILFHRTSGTTGKPKMIPVTRRCDRHCTLSHRMWIYHILLGQPDAIAGRVMAVLNAAVEGHTAQGIPYGAVSGNVYPRMPSYIRRAYAHPYDVAQIKTADARRYSLLRLAIGHDCTFLFTGNPASFLTLFEFADGHSEELIRDIRDGTLSAAYDIPDDIRAAAAPYLRKSPRRARMLAEARRRAGRLRPAEYWPDLSVIGCWIGGTVGHFSKHVKDLWCAERVVFRDVGYMASEGVFSIPLANDNPDSVLALHGIFFEFIPETAFGEADAPLLLAHELELGRNYHVVITTTGGLYRYAMNDVIRVTGFYEGSPKIRFLHKGSNVKNISGELMSADHILAAVLSATGRLGVKLRHFQAVADLASRRYAFCIEPIEELQHDLLRKLLERLDLELGTANENYAQFREDKLIQPPCLRLMKRGWFDRMASDYVARSQRESQFKPAVLVDTFEHPEMVEATIEADALAPWAARPTDDRRVG